MEDAEGVTVDGTMRPSIRLVPLFMIHLAACGEVTIRPDAADAAGSVALAVDASVFVRQGAMTTADVTITRDRFDGPVTIEAMGLGAGVTVAPLVIDAGSSTGTLEISAASDATHGITMATLSTNLGSVAPFEIVVAGSPGALDRSFADDGTVLPELGSLALGSRGLVMTPDGIVVTGFVLSTPYQALTARIRADGTLDPSFGSGGFVSTGVALGNGVAQGIAVASDTNGRIVAAGIAGGASSTDNDYGVLVYTSSGTLDQSFNGAGVASFDPGTGYGELHHVVVASDNSLLVGGTLFGTNTVTHGMRYSPTGVRDTTYQITEPDVYVEGAALQADGKLIMVGGKTQSFWLCRYTTTGTRDPAFGTGITTSFAPMATSASANSVLIQPDGKLLVVGTCRVGANDVVCLARYNANGSPDVTFGTSGKITSTIVLRAISATAAVMANDKIYFGGRSGTLPAVVRLNLDGSLDTTFGNAGIATVDFGLAMGPQTGVFGMGVDGRGRIVVSADVGPSGGQRMGVARLWQ